MTEVKSGKISSVVYGIINGAIVMVALGYITYGINRAVVGGQTEFRNDTERQYVPSLETDTHRKSKISTPGHVPTDSVAAPGESNGLPPATRSMVIGRNEQSPLQSSDAFVTPSNSRINLNSKQQRAVLNELDDAAR